MDKIFNIVNGKSYKQIDNQEEYDYELAWFNNEMKAINPFRLRNIPESFRRFNEIMDRAEGIGLFSKEFCDEKRLSLMNGLKDKNLKERVKEQLKKKGLIK